MPKLIPEPSSSFGQQEGGLDTASGEDGARLLSFLSDPSDDLFECYLAVQLEKEAPWLEASRSAICFVVFPVLLAHTRQCHPEYSGVRENAV